MIAQMSDPAQGWMSQSCVENIQALEPTRLRSTNRIRDHADGTARDFDDKVHLTKVMDPSR